MVKSKTIGREGMSFLVPKVCVVCGVKHLWDEVEELEE